MERRKLQCNDARHRSPLDAAVASGHEHIVEYFIHEKTGVSSSQHDHLFCTALGKALSFTCSNRNLMVQHLVQGGAHIDGCSYNSDPPYYTAIEYGQLEAAEHLIHLGVNINAR